MINRIIGCEKPNYYEVSEISDIMLKLSIKRYLLKWLILLFPKSSIKADGGFWQGWCNWPPKVIPDVKKWAGRVFWEVGIFVNIIKESTPPLYNTWCHNQAPFLDVRLQTWQFRFAEICLYLGWWGY